MLVLNYYCAHTMSTAFLHHVKFKKEIWLVGLFVKIQNKKEKKIHTHIQSIKCQILHADIRKKTYHNSFLWIYIRIYQDFLSKAAAELIFLWDVKYL